MAKNRIKGITIEIDGNTVKLDESLKDINSNLKDTEKNLKDVDKLLKLDPKNTDLLKQKQELLGSAINDTKEKLRQEQEALKALENAGDSEKTQKQQEALKREIVETTNALNKYEKQMRDMPNALDKIATKTDELAQKTAALSAASAVAVGGLVNMAIEAGKAADDLNTLSKQSGFSTEEIQKWQYASDLIDVSVDDIIKAGTKLTSKMASTPQIFEELGVSVTDASGNMRSVEEVFYDVVYALSQVDNATLRDQLSMEIFGKSANSLAGIIDDGGEALRVYGQEALDLGLILSEDALNGANAFNDGIDKMKAQTQAAFFELGGQLSEVFLPVMESVVEMMKEVVQWISNIDTETLELVTKVLLVTAVIAPLLKVLSTTLTLMSSIGKLIPGIVSGIGQIAGATATGTAATTAAGTAASATATTVTGSLAALSASALAVAGAIAAVVAVVAALAVYYGKKAEAEQRAANEAARKERMQGYTTKISADEAKYYKQGEYRAEWNGSDWEYYRKDNAKVVSAYSNDYNDFMERQQQVTNNYDFNVNVQNIDDIQQLVDMSDEAQLMNRMGVSY